MKKLIYLLLITLLFSCEEKGTTELRLNGNEPNLPDELKGIEIHKIWLNSSDYVNVAILNNQINSLSYKVGKTTYNTTIMVTSKDTLIKVKSIISENDSIIVFKK